MRLSSNPLALRRLDASNEADFLEIVRLYEEAFPESERKPLAALRCMLQEDRYHFLLATARGDTVGFAIVRELDSGAAALLEYLAIAPAQRRRNLGSQLFLATARAVAPSPMKLLIEIESDRVADAEQHRRRRLKQFYRRLGARQVQNLRWIMPPQAATPPPPMDLLIFPGSSLTLNRDELRLWITGIYTDVYGQSGDDPRLNTMLDGLPADVALL